MSVPNLTEAGVTAKQEKYDRRLHTIAVEVNDLENNGDGDNDDNVIQDVCETAT